MSRLQKSRTLVPSKDVLKFLRAQGHECTSCRLPYSHKRQINHATRSLPTTKLTRQSTQHMTTTSSNVAILESSLFPFDIIWPRKSIPSQLSSTTRLLQHADNLGSKTIKSHAATRHGSSHSNDSTGGFSRLWGMRKKQRESLQPDDLPPLSNFMDDSTSIGRQLRSPHEHKLRCTEFDEAGNVILVNGEFKKSELIAKVCPLPYHE